ncbi:hypothetical protein ACVI1L_004436 [Bradyrhizobium sp. USDA 4516]
MAKRGRTSGLERWRKTPACREQARRNAAANHERFRTAPRCGARLKKSSELCAKPAMKNGRCAIHGGKTPSGADWHVTQYPDCSTPAGSAKFNAKVRRQQKHAKQRAERLATMTATQRKAHENWHRSHRPGSRAARASERVRAEQAADARRLLEDAPGPAPLDPEALRIRQALAAAKARLAQLLEKTDRPSNDDEGIFA